MAENWPPTPAQQALMDKRSEIEQHDFSERQRLLASHREQLSLLRRALYARCERETGHAFYDLPNNGINHFTYATGEWPQSCRWCHMTKPPARPTPSDRETP